MSKNFLCKTNPFPWHIPVYLKMLEPPQLQNVVLGLMMCVTVTFHRQRPMCANISDSILYCPSGLSTILQLNPELLAIIIRLKKISVQ